MSSVRISEYVYDGVRAHAHTQELFTVRGASVEQMKAMCTALPLCHGFNSEGQFKSKITSKAKSPAIDLYLKQTVLGVKQNKVRNEAEASVGVVPLSSYRLMPEGAIALHVHVTLTCPLLPFPFLCV